MDAHPEGGFYREIYRSDETIPGAALPDRFKGDRNTAALINFLLPGNAFSVLRRAVIERLTHDE